MKYFRKAFLALILIAIGELFVFINLFNQNYLLEPRIVNGGFYWILYVVVALLMMCVKNILVLFLMSSYYNEEYRYELTWVTFVRTFFPILGARILVDAVQILFPKTNYTLYPSIKIVSELIFIAVVFVLTKRTLTKDKWNRSKVNQFTIAAGAVLILVLSLVCCLMIRSNLELIEYFDSKYVQYDKAQVELAIEFKNQGVDMVFNIGVKLIFLAVFYILYFKDGDTLNEVKSDDFKQRRIALAVYRCLTFGSLLGVVFLLRGIATPYGLMTHGMGSSNHYISNKIDFNDDNYISFDRYDFVDGKIVDQDIYTNRKIRIIYNDKVLVKYTEPIRNGVKTKEALVMCIDSAEYEAYRYGKDIIVYEVDGVGKYCFFKDIKNHEKDEALTSILQTLIEDGDFEFFECSYEYLIKYDRDFIVPYIERYKNDDFTDRERGLSKNIKQSYIAEVMRKVEA